MSINAAVRLASACYDSRYPFTPMSDFLVHPLTCSLENEKLQDSDVIIGRLLMKAYSYFA